MHTGFPLIKCIFKAKITGRLNAVLKVNVQNVRTAGAGVRSLSDTLMPSAFKRRV